MTKSPDTDPFRQVALIALQSSPASPGDMLEAVLRYAFDQLCWKRTIPELLALLSELRAIVSEDDASAPDLLSALTELEALLSEVAPEYAESTVAANARAAIETAGGKL